MHRSFTVVSVLDYRTVCMWIRSLSVSAVAWRYAWDECLHVLGVGRDELAGARAIDTIGKRKCAVGLSNQFSPARRARTNQ
jgi:hypothetical protein